MLREATSGRGPDAVIDAVGMEAHGSPGAAAVQRFVGLLPDAVASPLMQKAGLEVRARLDPSTPTITGNPGKLQQVFLNLFLNARDAMAPGGVLEVKTWGEDDGGVQIDVIDSGHGIAPEHIHRIYDPFFTTKGARKGTGLGLSVTYGIIQEHGGAIKVFSRPGGGTRFHLEFPPVTAKSRKPATV